MAKGEFEFRVDTQHNRLYMKLSGFFRDGESEEVYRAFMEAIDQLEPGFDVINDIRGFVPASPGAADTIKRAAEVIAERKIGRTIRVTGKVVSGLMQFKRLLSGATDVELASSVEEAERMLSEV